MENLSPEELLFLSNLMHIREEGMDENGETLFKDIWTNGKKGMTVKKLIEDIDTNKLATEYAKEIFDGEISGAEWAAMLEKIKDNKNICDLKLVDLERDDKKALSVCLEDKDGHQYVVFRGTSGGEWPDNFEGGYAADTEQQIRALEFVERQTGDNITVAGHSKGGNKAKYAAILSDKVGECYSFDGQGFSPAFWQKYGPLIEKNKDKITCFALDYDFVNILLPDVYGGKYYVNGHGVDNFAQNHSPNSFFNEEWEFDERRQSEAMESLHKFINYIVNTGEPEEVKKLMNYLGNVVNFAMGKRPPDYTESYSAEELREYLLARDNAEELGMLIAYIVQYERGGNHITGVLQDIMEGMDFGFFGEILSYMVSAMIGKFDNEIGLEALLKAVEIGGEPLSWLLEQLGLLNEDEAGTIAEALKTAQQKQRDIPLPNRNNCKDQTMSYIRRDFSDEMRTTLLNLVEEVENEEVWEFWRWDAWYRLEDWCGCLNVENYKNNIEEYHRKVIDINDTTKTQMQNIFNAIDDLDAKYGKLFQAKAEEFASITQEVRNIMA